MIAESDLAHDDPNNEDPIDLDLREDLMLALTEGNEKKAAKCLRGLMDLGPGEIGMLANLLDPPSKAQQGKEPGYYDVPEGLRLEFKWDKTGRPAEDPIIKSMRMRRIGGDVAAHVKLGKSVADAIAAVMKGRALSEATVKRAWAAYKKMRKLNADT